MINFKKVEIENFGSLGKVELNLNESENFILIDGDNQRLEDGAKSNGSGKSWLFESIIWALTGETVRGYKDVVNRYQDEDCKVKLSFNFKDSDWEIERTRSKKGGQGLKIWKDSKELEYKGLRDAEGVLQKYLPELTLNFLGSTIILGQGLPQRFTNNSPAGRKAILEELSNADFMISHIKENIKNRQDILASNLREVEDEMLVYSTKLGVAKKTKETAESDLELLRQIDISAKKAELEKLVEDGKQAKSDYEVAQEKVFKSEENYIKLSQALSKAEAIFSEDKSKVDKERFEKLTAIQKEYSAKFLKEAESLGPQIEAKKNELSDIKEQLAHKKAIISGGFCKLCGQKLKSTSEEELNNAKEFITANENKPADLITEIETLQKKKLMIGEDFKQAERAESICVDKAMDDKLDLLTKDFNERTHQLHEQVESAQQTLREAKQQVDSTNSYLLSLRSDYQAKKAGIDSYEQKILGQESIIKKASQEIEDYEKASDLCQNKRADFENRLKVVKSFDTFASRDFRGILLEDIVNQLDYNLHKYAEKVYGKPLTRFYQEGNTIGIQFDGKEYEGLSGGEKQKLDVLIQLSLRDLIIQTSGVEANLVVFDEIFDMLDITGCEALLKVISDLGLTVYSITHHQELNIPYDKRYVVVKESNGIAHLEVG